jgi:pyrroline-5-carboxylate reductase
MGKALAIGTLDAGAVEAQNLLVHDVNPAAAEGLSAEKGTQTVESLDELIRQCDVVLLCVKPYDVPGILQAIAKSGRDQDQLLVISVAAGVTVQTLEQLTEGKARIIRTMPNTPALIGKGAAAFTAGNAATDADRDTARLILGSVGTVVEVKESLMDVVTGLSGSGPGYVYLFIEALADGGVRNGLPREQALELATQTVLGAAEMVRSTQLHPAVLRDMVTSPGGTTMAGLAALESCAFRSACIDAITAATERSLELGRD